jgi:integrase
MRAVLDAGIDWSGQLRRNRDLVMLLVGYLLALRRSELCALHIRDVRLERTQALVTIEKSKTDQDQRGARLATVRPDGILPHLDAVGLLGSGSPMLGHGGAGPDVPLFPSPS